MRGIVDLGKNWSRPAWAGLSLGLLVWSVGCQREGVPAVPPPDSAAAPGIGPANVDASTPLWDALAASDLTTGADEAIRPPDGELEAVGPNTVVVDGSAADAHHDVLAVDATSPAEDVSSAAEAGAAADNRPWDSSAAVACQTVDDCGPDEACRARSCQAGVCVYLPIAQGIACGNGLLCDGAGLCTGCAGPHDCPGAETECQTRTCVQGVCGLVIAKPGTRLSYQTPGDCHADVCNAAGVAAKVVDDTDLPVDNLACTRDVCTAGVPSNPALAAGAECGSNGVCDGKGACTGCVVASDCPGQESECRTRVCNAGVCGFDVANAGKVLAAQASGDCRKLVCDGLGGTTSVIDDADVPADDGNACTDDTCSSGAPVHPPKSARTPCSGGGGILCNGLGTCVACLQASDCGTSSLCRVFACASDRCETTLVSAGTKVGNATVGDCRSDQCDGQGSLLINAVDNTDVPADDGNVCTAEVCTSGAPQHPAKTTGSSCNQGGVLCDNTATCTNPPALVSTSPTDGAVTALGAAVTVTFSVAMNAGTLIGQGGAGPCTGSIQVSLDDFASCVALTGPQMSAANTSATFTPAPGLLSGRTYKIRVSSAAQGATGLPLPSTFTMPTGFQTKSPDSCLGSLVISQIYGGGGSSTSDTPYQSDYVQLHNRGATAVDLTGYSLQYAAATGDTWSSAALTGSIAAGGFFLIQLGTPGPQGQALPSPDASGSNISLSATAGKIALVHASVAMPRGTCPSSDAIDFVGYGAANCSRSSNAGENAAPLLSYLGALVRAANGCTNNNLNSSDFTVATPAPAGKSAPAVACTCPPVILNETGHPLEADLCNVQPPLDLTIAAGTSTAVIKGQVYEAGLTEAAGAAPAARAQLGIGPANRNPEYESGWSWTDAGYDSQVGQSDQYATTLPPSPAGSYRFVYRVSLDGGNSWTYCDGAQADGGAGAGTGMTFDLENMGVLTVTP